MILLWGGLQTEWGQNWLVGQVTKKLSKDLKAHIAIKHIRLHFFDKMDLEGLLVEDQHKDTLLYAGSMQVNITDWFFLKDKAELHYIGLSDARVYFNRTDSVWNYNFLADYFASPSQPADTTTRKKAGIAIDLKKLVLKNVDFIQRDAWAGSDMNIHVGSLDLDAEDISLSSQTFKIAKLKLVDPSFTSFSYKGRRPYPGAPSPPLNLILKQVSIVNGHLKLDDESKLPAAGSFDTKHLDFTAINGNLTNFGFAGDTLRGFLNISAKERSGLVVKSLKANTTIQPGAMIFDNLFLQTNNSVLTDYFALRYKDNMDDFEHRVNLEANFNKASISSSDLGFFASDAKTWNRLIRINGKVKGTVDDLNARNLEVWAGNKTYVNGNLNLVGLPDFNSTFINLDAKSLQTTYSDAVSFIPSLRKVSSPNLRKLQYLQFNGTFTGFVNDFVTYGTLKTALGTITTDLNMKIPSKAEPRYSGKLSTEGFDLGQFLNNDQLGIIDFHGRVKGTSFDWNKLDMDLDGLIHRFEFGNYTYQNIKARGNLSRKKFNGDFDITDPNANLHLNGLVDLSGTLPRFNMKADVAKIDLKALHFSDNELELSGIFDLDIQGNSLANILGSARMSKARLVRGKSEILLDSFMVESGYFNGIRTLTARSNEFNASISGDFDLASLPQSFRFFLSRYYPSYITVPSYVKPQAFSFDITTGVVEDYIRLIDTSLSGFNNSHIVGALNTITNTMNVDADIPYFTYKKLNFSDLQLKGSGNLEKLELSGSMNNAVVSETVNFPQTNFRLEAQNDVSHFSISTTSNQTINKADLSAEIRTFSDGLTILFDTSSFVLNGKVWSIEQGGELNFRRNTVVQGQVLLKEGAQEIRIATHPSAIGNWNDLFITLRSLNLGDIAPFVTPKNRLEGLLNGEVIVEDPQNKFNVVTNLSTEQLRFDNDSLGQVQVGATYNNKSGLITGKGSNLDPDHHIDFDLAIDLKDSANTFRDRISLHPKNFQLKYLERFIGSLFSDINGYLTGDIDIIGEGSDRDYLAKVKLKDAGFKVNFTQVYYTIDDTEIQLKKDLIDLNGITLRDKNKRAAQLRGNITHHGFGDMFYDLQVVTDPGSDRLQLLNTNYNDNQQFYGRAYGSGTFALVGPQNNIVMDINVKASEEDSSYITLPPSNARQSAQADFMVERKYGKEMTATSLSGAATNLKYFITLTANPHVNMEVVLDELTGDIIKGRGNGVLAMSAGTTTPLTINGRYEIEEGNYVFTFQSFFKKPFVLRRGATNFIEWSGDPYKANINLEAVYTAENVSFSPLSQDRSGVFSRLSNLRDNVNVIAHLTGQLFQPTFNFSLEFPGSSSVYRDPGVAFGLQQIEKNPNELNKQVTYLIVFNSFAPYETQQAIGGNPFNEALNSSISAFLFGEINKKINEVLGEVLRQNNITLNFSGSFYNRNLVDPNQKGLLRINQSDVNVTIGKQLFNNRVVFTVGGTFDVPINNDFQQSIRLFPDVTVEFLLNKSGSVRASFFYRESADVLTTGTTGSNFQSKRYGTALSYGKEFDSKRSKYGKLKPVADTAAPKPTPDGTH